MKNNYKNIFIFAYYSFKDPIFQSAVLPYFRNLNSDTKLRFIILTFEQQKYKITDKSELNFFQDELNRENILWFQTSWHSGRFKILKKAFDFAWGLIYASYLILRFRAKAIYSEGFPGAVIAHHLATLFRVPHLVHTYEPHTDYMIEAGVWKKSSWEARLLKKSEVKVAFRASFIFTATKAMIDRLKLQGVNATLHRVPSCVDASCFYYSEKHRKEIRSKFNVNDDDCVIVYLGKFGGMYMDEEIFDFMYDLEQDKLINFKYFILTPDDHSYVYSFLNKKKLNKEKFIVKTLNRLEVSKFLSASDFGLVPVRQNPSKRFCSPIKDGEYWACGLPIIIPKGISDDYIFCQQYKIGIVMDDTSKISNNKVLNEIKVWLREQSREDVIKRCRSFALSDRSIEKYKSLYKEIFMSI
ncbi:hypothetical protein HUW51_14220 [Adhaeribacter swui]|uniref:Glycosyltransferase family 4 protein n=1 Tax=Adhaeribacter swui TaxID=2086471 RepID=A0A7G7G9I4_9BACT|nr:glycosyltransferase [Adhaeribacter swui]QNF33818.1 hypothetical protein HUW51_14220 [Adhaeribacter swui]